MFALFCIFVGASAGRFAATGQVMTGKPQRVPANEPDVLAAARFAVVEFNRADAEDRFAYRIVNVTSAKIQVRLLLEPLGSSCGFLFFVL